MHTLPKRATSSLRAFLDSEAAGGVLLMIAAGLALITANSPAAESYFHTLHIEVLGLSLGHWINDGLMALFFLLVGLEIKREVVLGELSTWRRRALPGVAALGGMIVPAGIYLAFNLGETGAPRGWAIPAATDIAFALGVLSLLGSKAPASLKIFLAALAIIDDLGAILIIAFFYTSDLTLWALAGAGGATAVLIALNALKVKRLWPYLLIGAALWFLLLKSGVHATLAGVVLALTIPLAPSPATPEAHGPLHRLEHGLNPWVAYLIVPVFGFANAGVALGSSGLAAITAPAALGVAAGLFLGKPLGVFLFSLAAIGLGAARRPSGTGWTHLFGVSVLCGIGFTMSLFINNLAFADPVLREAVKVGVLAGSVLSAVAGWIIFSLTSTSRPAHTDDQIA